MSAPAAFITSLPSPVLTVEDPMWREVFRVSSPVPMLTVAFDISDVIVSFPAPVLTVLSSPIHAADILSSPSPVSMIDVVM